MSCRTITVPRLDFDAIVVDWLLPVLCLAMSYLMHWPPRSLSVHLKCDDVEYTEYADRREIVVYS